MDGILWVFITAGVAFLLIASGKKSRQPYCSGLNIQLTGTGDNFFIDKNDIQQIVVNYLNGKPETKSIESIDLGVLERRIEKDNWVKNAEVYIDNNNLLHVCLLYTSPSPRD